jgi:branched-chain amino acid transport system substrate-binding protein
MKNQRKAVAIVASAVVAALCLGTTAVSAKSAAPASAKKTCPAKPDESLDTTYGKGAGALEQALACGEAKPLKADNKKEPVLIGIMNPEGDPAGSFPEYTVMAQAAADYINKELGGVGADYVKGVGGRPIKLEVCKMAINPADSQKCANELAAKKPLVVYSTLNFFGNHFSILNNAKIPVVVGTPISPADFTTKGVYAIGGGGGCLGVHTGLVQFATENVLKYKKNTKVGVPWANTPPGVFCYHDLEKKPLNVLNGTQTVTTAKLKGKMAGMTHIGVPIKPGSPDVTPDAQKVLDFGPDVVIFSGQGADCWTLVNSMLKLGWTPAKTPLVLSAACTDLTTMKALGNKIKGVYTVGATSILDPDSIVDPQLKRESKLYNSKGAKYASDKTSKDKGFGTQGFTGIMAIWQMANQLGKKLTGPALTKAFEATTNQHAFAGSGIACKKAVKPYVAVCNSTVSAQQWNGKALKQVRENFTGLNLVAGTALDFGK